jgi:hypothetical protein
VKLWRAAQAAVAITLTALACALWSVIVYHAVTNGPP